jgi:hypothetical protein
MKVSIPEVHYVNFAVPDGTPPAEAKQMALKKLAEQDWDSLDYSHTDENPDNFLIDGVIISQ